jgi:GWxTD domain-containing protein
MKRIAAAVVISLFSISIFAAGLSRSYKDWLKTPMSYYLTEGEKKQWSALQSDAEAEQFIKDFIARRGGETFTKDVGQNAAQADKYLTVGKTSGSQTARGKMMILLGPAAPSAVTKKKKAGEVRMAPSTIGMSGIDAGPSLEDMQTASNDPGNSTYYITEYAYTYPAASLPAAYGKPLTVKFEVEPDKDRDRLIGIGAEKELDKLYEMAAQAKLAAAKPATP